MPQSESRIERNVVLEGRTFADIGCSNGYLTSLINDRFKPAAACGYDHDRDNLAQARANHPGIRFERIELNNESPTVDTYDVVTCFEVLEHVGGIETALENLLNLVTRAGGVLFLTVPIEIGWRGALKFLVKTTVYRYRTDELPRRKQLYLTYLGHLLTNKRMSGFRDCRKGWGTHFGFDHREIDDYLKRRGRAFEVSNRGMTRFYLVRG